MEEEIYATSSGLEFDVQPAVWLSDYVLFSVIIVLTILLYALEEHETYLEPFLVSFTTYYLAFALGFGFGGIGHQTSYYALRHQNNTKQVAALDEENNKPLELEGEGDSKLKKYDMIISFVWRAASACNVVAAGALLVVSSWLVLVDNPATSSSIVVAVVILMLALIMLGIELDFRIYLFITSLSILTFAICCAIEELYLGLAYSIVSLILAALQQFRIGVSKKYFNHNALFHSLILLTALPLLHLTALELI